MRSALFATALIAMTCGNEAAAARGSKPSPVKAEAAVKAAKVVEPIASEPAGILRVAVIEATIPEAKAETLEVDKLDPDRHDVARLLTKLRELGTAKLLIRDVRPVVLGGQAIEFRHGKEVPFVRGENTLSNGRTQTRVQYENVGVLIRLHAQSAGVVPGKKAAYAVMGTVEYSGLAESGTPIASGGTRVGSRGTGPTRIRCKRPAGPDRTRRRTPPTSSQPTPTRTIYAPVFCKMKGEHAMKLYAGEPALFGMSQRMPSNERKPDQFVVVIVRLEIAVD